VLWIFATEINIDSAGMHMYSFGIGQHRTMDERLNRLHDAVTAAGCCRISLLSQTRIYRPSLPATPLAADALLLWWNVELNQLLDVWNICEKVSNCVCYTAAGLRSATEELFCTGAFFANVCILLT
jgi:hypothetical protein